MESSSQSRYPKSPPLTNDLGKDLLSMSVNMHRIYMTLVSYQNDILMFTNPNND